MDRLTCNPPRDSESRDRDHWRRVKQRIDRELARWIPELTEDSAARPTTPIGRSFAAGKRVRGGLLCLVCDALGGRMDAALPRAVAIECVHLASLIHDDFIDGDRTRRHHPTLWTIDGARQAVLLADMMFATAIRKMIELDPADGATIATAIARTAHGAYLEFRSTQQPIRGRSSDCYLQVIGLKTGALFAAAARMGATAAGASPALCEQASGFGTNLGAAYQIADDLTELTANAAGATRGHRHPCEVRAILQHFTPLGPRVAAPVNGEPRDPQDLDRETLDRCTTTMRRTIGSQLRAATSELRHFPLGPPTTRLRRMAVASIETLISGVG